ncbi:hypothetical protein E7811_00810 [Aliigemmobacter aestuarii]|uniref:Uncharacterized protein n=1 Tax=Aliigemmobacter aestuarii TaxID=1445661 RepID=A0A4S3MPC7_9RHOB|nr:hypothetical protein [Gemmobacter aestuarii]THD84326.1 hypothetical protein E7811_00810 [Gemmobacter aestuarii]
MQMNHAAFARSPALRVSLKRGLARQAIATAGRDAPDMPGLIRMASGLRPNIKAVERLALRLKVRPGVARVTMAPGGKALTFVTRAVREVEARVEGATAFQETGLIYLRARVGMAGPMLAFQLSAVSFCVHALERLVERSDIALQTALLPQVDAEAQAIFRGWDRAARILEAGDEYYPAASPGLWAGGHDEMALDPDWGLSNGCGRLPVFSARTFLSEAEMRPTVWLRWKDDPACRMA